MAECISCEEEYSDKRLALGYETCLICGENEARGIIAARTHAKLCEMTPYVSGSLTQPDALFEKRPGSNAKYKAKQYVVGE
tara:strand:+ start:746 stop:988 length:243 start_codon:yes stop_codon:yes gene_type:complete